jgi:hypothetical protein
VNLALHNTLPWDASQTAIPDNEAWRGPVYTFVPAAGESRVGAVQRELNRTWAEDLALTVLLADFSFGDIPPVSPNDRRRQVKYYRRDNTDVMEAGPSGPGAIGDLLDFSRRNYDVVSIDLTGTRESVATEVLRASTSIFIVSDSTPQALNSVAEQIGRLRSLNLEDRCGLLLRAVPNGVRPDVAEELSGLPVCGLAHSTLHIQALARWLGSEDALRLSGII